MQNQTEVSGSGSEATEGWWHRHVTRSRGGVEKSARLTHSQVAISSIKTNEMSKSTMSTEKPQKGTMHAFPATGGNVAVSHGGKGAGSIAVASGVSKQSVDGGVGVSQRTPTAAPGGNAKP